MKKLFCFVVVSLLFNLSVVTFAQAQTPSSSKVVLTELPDEELSAEEPEGGVVQREVSGNHDENPDSYVYCKMVYGWKRSMMLDFGIKGLDVYVTDDDGKRMAFYDEIAALNCMSARGWELADIFTLVSQGSINESISSGERYVLRKKLSSLNAQERDIYEKYIK